MDLEQRQQSKAFHAHFPELYTCLLVAFALSPSLSICNFQSIYFFDLNRETEEQETANKNYNKNNERER